MFFLLQKKKKILWYGFCMGALGAAMMGVISSFNTIQKKAAFRSIFTIEEKIAAEMQPLNLSRRKVLLAEFVSNLVAHLHHVCEFQVIVEHHEVGVLASLE